MLEFRYVNHVRARRRIDGRRCTGCTENRGTSRRMVILRAKVDRKRRTTIFNTTLRSRENQLSSFMRLALLRFKRTRTRLNFIVDFLENEVSYQKFLFYAFHLLFHE